MVQTYGSGDSGSGDVVERPDQAALPDRRGDLLEGGGRRGGSWQACLLPRGGHGAPDLREILRGLVVHYTHHEGERKMFVCKNQNYLKNKAEIKNHKKNKRRKVEDYVKGPRENKMGRGISTTRQMSRGLRGNTCDATKRPWY